MREIQFCFRKSLVVIVIFLFIGVSVAPGINAFNLESNLLINRVSNDIVIQEDELKEITVQICRTDEIENHTIMLSEVKFSELQALINNFKVDLDNAERVE